MSGRKRPWIKSNSWNSKRRKVTWARHRSPSHHHLPYSERNISDVKERVKRCLSCEHFSTDHIKCANCGLELRRDAKLFRDPFKVNSVFKDLIHVVTNIGPDFQPMRLPSRHFPSSKVNAPDDEVTTSNVADFKCDEHESQEDEQEEIEPVEIITITSEEEDEHSDNEDHSEWPEVGHWSNPNATDETETNNNSTINDDDTTDLLNEITIGNCPPHYFVKKCSRCYTFSFDLQTCETCGKKISKKEEIILYQSLSKRKLKSDKWRKLTFRVTSEEGTKINSAKRKRLTKKKLKELAKAENITEQATDSANDESTFKRRRNRKKLQGNNSTMNHNLHDHGNSNDNHLNTSPIKRKKNKKIKERLLSQRAKAEALRAEIWEEKWRKEIYKQF